MTHTQCCHMTNKDAIELLTTLSKQNSIVGQLSASVLTKNGLETGNAFPGGMWMWQLCLDLGMERNRQYGLRSVANRLKKFYEENEKRSISDAKAEGRS